MKSAVSSLKMLGDWKITIQTNKKGEKTHNLNAIIYKQNVQDFFETYIQYGIKPRRNWKCSKPRDSPKLKLNRTTTGIKISLPRKARTKWIQSWILPNFWGGSNTSNCQTIPPDRKGRTISEFIA